MIESKEIGEVLKSLDCTMEYDIVRDLYILRLDEAPAWTIEISALETLQNYTEVALLNLITAKAANLRAKYREDMKNYYKEAHYPACEPKNREVYFVGGPMHGKSLVLNNGAPVYTAAVMSSMVDMSSSPSNFVAMDDVYKNYLYDIVRSQYGTEITYYGIGQEHNKDILAAFRAQTDLLKRIQDDDPYWELRLKKTPPAPRKSAQIPDGELERWMDNGLASAEVAAMPAPDCPMCGDTGVVTTAGYGSWPCSCSEKTTEQKKEEWKVEPENESAWDKKLREELENGDDTWGAISKKYK